MIDPLFAAIGRLQAASALLHASGDTSAEARREEEAAWEDIMTTPARDTAGLVWKIDRAAEGLGDDHAVFDTLERIARWAARGEAVAASLAALAVDIGECFYGRLVRSAGLDAARLESA